MKDRENRKNETGNRIVWIMILFVLFLAGISQFIDTVPSGEVITKEKSNNPTITILAGQSTSDAGIEEMIQKVLEEKFPYVNFEWVCVGWNGDNYKMRLTGKYAIGNPPDIIIGKAQDAVSYAESGVLLKIPEKCAVGIRDEDKKMVSHNGDLYAIPYTCQYQGVLYNKAVFEQYDLKPPSTQEELDEIVETLEKNGITPFASHFQESWQVGNNTMQFFMNEIFQYDPKWGEKLRDGRKTFRRDATVEKCFRNSEYILKHSWHDALQIDQFECDERFGKGSAAMYLTGSWSLQSISQVTQDMNIGIFPYPNENGDAKLIKETNISFMKGAHTRQSELVDEILLEIGTNQKLAKEVADYTKGESTLKSLEDYRITEVQEDIGCFEKENKVIDVTIGNTQLIWSFQSDVAEEELIWLRGRKTLNEVLYYADKNIQNSVAEK